MATFYDSTLQKLPLLSNDYNLSNSGPWEVVTLGYNDTGNLTQPWPRLKLNYGHQQCAFAWNAERYDANGEAMYDAQYLFPTGIDGDQSKIEFAFFRAHPNPCSAFLNLSFELKEFQHINITLSDITGRTIGVIADQNYTKGIFSLKIDVSSYPCGNYLCNFMTPGYSKTSKIIVIR